MQQDFSAFAAFRILAQQTIRSRQWHVAHLARRFFAAARLLQFAVAPKRSITQYKIARNSPLLPTAVAPRQ